MSTNVFSNSINQMRTTITRLLHGDADKAPKQIEQKSTAAYSDAENEMGERILACLAVLARLHIPVTAGEVRYMAHTCGAEDETLKFLHMHGIRLDDDESSVTAGTSETRWMDRRFAENVLRDLVSSDMADEKTIIAIEKSLFSLKYFFGGEKAPCGMDLSVVLTAFNQNERNRRIIIGAKRLHSLEFAIVAAKGRNRDSSLVRQEISCSFRSLVECYQDDPCYVNIAWIKYFNFASSFTCQIPEALTEYVSKKNYRILFDLLKKYTSKSDRHKDTEQQINSRGFIIAVCEKILHEIDESDVPAKLILGKTYEEQNQFEEARDCYSGMLATDSFFSGVTSVINTYEKEIRYLLNAKYGENPNTATLSERIQKINGVLEDFYEHWESELLWRINICEASEKDKLKEQYITLVTKHARHEKNRREFKLAYEMLSKLSASISGSFRIPLEYGLLFQTEGSNYRKNEYYDPAKAITMFSEALNLLENESAGDTIRAQKSVLMPMANTYYAMGENEKALEVCERVLCLDQYEKNAQRLKRALRNIQCA